MFLILIVGFTLFYIDHQNLRNKILENQSVFYEKISNNFKLINIGDKNLNIKKDFICHEKYNLNLLLKDCLKNNNSKTLIYFFGDSSMHDYYYAFRSLKTKANKLFSSYNNSSFRKPIEFKTPPIHFTEKVNLFSKEYVKIYLILSFNHKLNHELSNKNDKYFINQEKIYTDFANYLIAPPVPKNIHIIFIKDTPVFKYTDKQCYMLAKYSLSIFFKNKNEKKCDHSKINILKKMKKINKMFQNLDNIDNLSLINLDDYFCEGMMCSFYKNNETENIPKKEDGYHLSLIAAKDIANFLNKKLYEHIND